MQSLSDCNSVPAVKTIIKSEKLVSTRFCFINLSVNYQELCSLIKRSRYLIHLDISWNSLRSYDMYELIDVISENRLLQWLYLSFNRRQLHVFFRSCVLWTCNNFTVNCVWGKSCKSIFHYLFTDQCDFSEFNLFDSLKMAFDEYFTKYKLEII